MAPDVNRKSLSVRRQPSSVADDLRLTIDDLRFIAFFLGCLTLVLLAACGGETAVPTPTLSPQAQLGKQVFSRVCAACHSTTEETIIVGPSLAGIADRAGSRIAGQDAETYLLTSVLDPDAYLVEGYEDLMPADLAKELTGEELDAVIVYLQTLE